VHGNYAKGYIVEKDMSLTHTFVAKSGEYFAHGETIKQAVADADRKRMENMPVADKIAVFNEQYPTNDEKISGKELFEKHGFLTGSCMQGRQSFVSGRYSLDDTYTVPEFISICKDAYGGEIIRRLAESRGIEA
ncbi:MAG: hypothetical protein HUK08_08065, partial [Bacteroidaceae bacterium]|nr:hypothetical protein [Bacteroidaceae bacterium]